MRKKKTWLWIFSLVLVLLVVPMKTFAANPSDISYAVTGGNIYFDKNTGTITDCDLSVTEAVIPKKIDGVDVKTIGYQAFKFCENLVQVTLPEGLTKIDDGAFVECSKLENISLPDSIVELGGQSSYDNGVFEGCSSLKNIVIPDGVTSIKSYMFIGCSSLESIVLPDNLTEIMDYVFQGCSSLKNIVIPKQIKKIERSCFYNCASLSSVILPEGLESIESNAFFGCTSLTNLIIPSTVKYMGTFSFYDCENLTHVVIPDGVEQLSRDCFNGCRNLTSIEFPVSLNTIEDSAFCRCDNLKGVYYAGTEEQWNQVNVVEGDTWNAPLMAADFHFSYEGPNLTKIRDFVERLYTEILGRPADCGINNWVEVLRTGTESGAKVAMGFVDSDEFKSKPITDEEYIEIMYRTFLGRGSDPVGKDGWKKNLDEGVSRLFVFKGFVESDEFTNICDSYGIIRGNAELTAPMDQNEKVTKFVARCYKVFLGRKGDVGGINGWANQLLTESNNAKEAAYGFVMSPEFQNKGLSNEDYVRTMYIGLMDREADGGGLKGWVDILEGGGSREEIFYGFADSLEFRDLARSYGLSGDWKEN